MKRWNMPWWGWLLPALIILVVVGMRWWPAGVSGFSLLKAHHGELVAWVSAAPLLAAGSFFVVFVLATSLSIPVATLLTLLAGSLFGFTEALLLVSFASTAGATLAMLFSRYFFREPVEQRWPRWVSAINRGLERDGDFYLLALRLAPTPPYFVVNLLMGLTRLPAWRFFLVSQIGMLPLDVVFVNAGRTLATLDSPEDILDAGTLAALMLAGLLPLVLRKLMRPPAEISSR